MNLIPEISRFFYLCILLILAIYSLLTIKKSNIYVKIYCVLIFIVEVVGSLNLNYLKTPFEVLYNIMALVEMICFVYFYFYLFAINKKINLPFLSMYFIVFLSLGNFNLVQLNIKGFLLNNALITVYISYYFYIIIKKNVDINGYFWISVGGLFYYFGSFLLNGMIFLIAKVDPHAGNLLFSLNLVLNMFFYSFVLYGLLKLDRDFDKSLSNN
jgi:hypothetical protein